jgi:serine/threonine protein kinase, bacterial
MGGSGGAAPTCPGTQVGCVVDWAGKFGTSASASMDGTGTAAVFGGNDAARALTGDSTYLYVAGSNCIRRVHLVTAVVETIVGQCGTSGYSSQAGTQARFGAVDGMAHSGGKLWVNDAGNYLIREITLSNVNVSTLSGALGNPGFQSGTPGNSRYEGLLGMTFISPYLFITEGPSNEDVRRIDSTTGNSGLIAGGNGAGNQNGTGSVAEFDSARKIGTNGTDLFVVDTENNRVRRIVLGGGSAFTNTVSTFVGSTAGFMDATGTAAQLRRPRGITFDGTDFYLADSDNCVIRKITAAGVVTTIAGKYLAGGCANHAEGLTTAAEFNKPMDIYFDPGSGDLFISEGTVIRRMYL